MQESRGSRHPLLRQNNVELKMGSRKNDRAIPPPKAACVDSTDDTAVDCDDEIEIFGRNGVDAFLGVPTRNGTEFELQMQRALAPQPRAAAVRTHDSSPPHRHLSLEQVQYPLSHFTATTRQSRVLTILLAPLK